MTESATRIAPVHAPQLVNSSESSSSNPLYGIDVLQQVLSYVGPGQHLFLSAVCSLWRAVYPTVPSRHLTGHTANLREYSITCCAQMTLYSSVFASPARVQVAHCSGLNLNKPQCQYAAGKYASAATLLAACALGAQVTIATLKGAAAAGDLTKLMWLHSKQQCRLGDGISLHAAMSGSVAVLSWLSEHSTGFTAVTCAMAARYNQLGALQFLRAADCDWGVIVSDAAAETASFETLRWCREHGCPWDSASICEAAARGGSVQVLCYLQQRGMVITPAQLTAMLNAAGAHSKLAAAQWLREQGAEWPAILRYEELYHKPLKWSGAALAWARAEGCDSPTQWLP
jgi:hypothetical protein